MKEYNNLPNDIVIIDDFIPEFLFDRVYDDVTSFDFPWFYLKDTTYRSKYSNDESLWDDGFSCLIYLKRLEENYEFKAPIYDVFKPILSHCEFVLGVGELIRCKVNMSNTSINSDPFEPHVDIPDIKTVTGLLCLNDSSGPTYIYNQKCPPGLNTNEALNYFREHKHEFEILYAIEPKKNRMIIFDGSYYHSGSRPSTNKVRLNINFNWNP